ncbi:MAG TPA: hypothetical protein PK857_06915 [Hyphomicrobium sp.]|nr:hypothetical protein [Hyphomicrobium sp.]HRO48756.1 hypothetical protein [Hyphomicrobium sp.]
MPTPHPGPDPRDERQARLLKWLIGIWVAAMPLVLAGLGHYTVARPEITLRGASLAAAASCLGAER